jgi:NAD(P)-dependent dehydrogenase (short-subunit alcohol dehydrogenase family)
MRPLASKSRPAQTLARSRHPKIRNRSQSRTLRPSKQAVDRSVHLSAGERPIAVNISSTLASIGTTWQAGRYAYRTSKAALNMLTRSIGEWYAKRGIILVSISPGWTRSEMGGP